MKQILSFALALLPCLAWAQYPSNGNQKITLGEQTTADGLIWRGVAADTTLTVKSDTAAYFVLDTANLNLYTYKASASGKKWIQLGSDTTSLNLVSRFAAKLNISDTASMLTPYWRSGRFSGTLPVANGGTNASTFTEGSVVFAGASGTYTQDNSNLFWDNTNKRLGIGTNTGVNTLTIKQASASMRIESTTGTNFADFRIANTGGTLYYGISRSTGGIFGLEGAYEGLVFYGNTNQNNLMIATGGHLRFLTSNDNGSSYPERMRISSGGNVGIGTTTPGSRLVVKGVTNTSGESALNVTNSSDNSLLFVRNDGNVGIGTTSPNYKLDLVSSTDASLFQITSTASANNTALRMGIDGNNTFINATGGSSGTLQLRTYGSIRATLDTDGNLGIGTTSPTNLLTLNTLGGDVMPVLGANGGKLGIISGNMGYGLIIGVPASGTATLQSQYINTTASALNMSLQPLGGNVGIGTASPTFKLDVNGTGRFSGALSGTSASFSSSITINSIGSAINLIQSAVGSATYYVMQNTVETGGKRYRFGYTGGSLDKGSFSIYNETDNIMPFLISSTGAATFSSSVTATAPSSGIAFQVNGRSSDNIGQILFYANNGTTLQNYIQSRPTYFSINTETNTPIYFNTNQGGGGGTAMTITGAGNVGINTASPSEKLHVVGNGLFTDTMRVEDAIKVGANNAYVYSAGTGNYYFTKDYKNQNGLYHIAIGNGVLSNATTVSDPTSSRHGSVAIGFNNLKNLNQSGGGNNGLYNTSIGYNNMSSMTTGNFNTAIGADALKSMTTGFSNAGLGSSTLESSTTGERNLAIGNGALRFITTGNDNIGIGSNAGIFDAVGGDFVTSLNNSIYIGSRADPSAITGVTNEIVIGKDAKGQGSNSIMLGNSSVTNAYCYDTSLSSPSDFRDKTNIENLQTGLDLIMSLRPVKFQWNMRDYGKVGYKDIGFIAQEALDVQNINNEADNIKLVSDENQNQLSMQSANLIPILVKAIQDQQAQIELLKQRLLILENK